MTGNTTTWTPPEWASDFCKDHTLFLFSAGKWTLIAGVLLGIALALATTYLLVRKPPPVGNNLEAVVPATGILDAAKTFLQALSSAPTWLALFGAGVLLLWLAGNTRPEACKPPPAPNATVPQPQQREAPPQAQPARPGNSQ